MMKHRYGLRLSEIMEFEDTTLPFDLKTCRILFPFEFDPPYPAPAFETINNEREENGNYWSRFRMNFRPFIGQYPFNIDILDCLDMDSVKVKNFISYNKKSFVISNLKDEVYEMNFNYSLMRGYDIVNIDEKFSVEVMQNCTVVSEREALQNIVTFIYPFDCNCLRNTPKFVEVQSLGFDTTPMRKDGLAIIKRCIDCGRLWATYEVEYEDMSPGSNIWFYEIIDNEKAKRITSSAVVSHLASLGWYYKHTHWGLLRTSGPLDVYGSSWE
jgi:hypothetical protein